MALKKNAGEKFEKNETKNDAKNEIKAESKNEAINKKVSKSSKESYYVLKQPTPKVESPLKGSIELKHQDAEGLKFCKEDKNPDARGNEQVKYSTEVGTPVQDQESCESEIPFFEDAEKSIKRAQSQNEQSINAFDAHNLGDESNLSISENLSLKERIALKKNKNVQYFIRGPQLFKNQSDNILVCDAEPTDFIPNNHNNSSVMKNKPQLSVTIDNDNLNKNNRDNKGVLENEFDYVQGLEVTKADSIQNKAYSENKDDLKSEDNSEPQKNLTLKERIALKTKNQEKPKDFQEFHKKPMPILPDEDKAAFSEEHGEQFIGYESECELRAKMFKFGKDAGNEIFIEHLPVADTYGNFSDSDNSPDALRETAKYDNSRDIDNSQSGRSVTNKESLDGYSQLCKGIPQNGSLQGQLLHQHQQAHMHQHLQAHQISTKKKKVSVLELETRFHLGMHIINSTKKFGYWDFFDHEIYKSPILFISYEVDDANFIDAITLASNNYAISFNQNVGLLYVPRFIQMLTHIFNDINVKKVIFDYTGFLECQNATVYAHFGTNFLCFNQIDNFHDIASTLEYGDAQKRYFVGSSGHSKIGIDRISQNYFNEQLVKKKPNWKTYESSNTLNHIRRAYIYALAIIKIYEFQLTEQWNIDNCMVMSVSKMNLTAKYLCDYSFYKGYCMLKEKGVNITCMEFEQYKMCITKAKKEGSVIITTDLYFAKKHIQDNVILMVD